MNIADASAIYAGTTEGKAAYYGPKLLWNISGWEPLPNAEVVFTGAASSNEFGSSVSINSRGDRVVIGAPRNQAGGSSRGAVSVFGFSAGVWSQLGSDIIGSDFDRLGSSVSMNSTGDIFAAISSGNARVFEWTGNNWVQRGANISVASCFRVSLSSDGDVIAIGSPDGLNFSGFSEIYEWTGTAWNLRGARILSEVSGDRSGQSVSLSADGVRVAIGSRYSDSGGEASGQARVFEWSGSAWTQVGASIPGAAAGDEAGFSVSLNSTGTRIAIGARFHDIPDRNAGHVRVFEEQDGQWVQMGQAMNGEAIDNWSGGSVSLNAIGDIVAIGAARNNGDAGHVRIYQWNGTSWKQQGTDIDGDAAGDRFGSAVALNSAGSILIAGAPLNSAAAFRAGAAKVIPVPILGVSGVFINSNATSDLSHTLNTPAHREGDLLIAVVMWRSDKGNLTPPSGWTLYGTYLSEIVVSGISQNLIVYTKTASSSEPESYTWFAENSTRNCGLIAAIKGVKIKDIREVNGGGQTAQISTSANRLNLTIFTWIFAQVSNESYNQTNSNGSLLEITDSPNNEARISGGFTLGESTVTSTHFSSTDNPPGFNHGGICIELA